jgi:anti-sigma B factor antagonist
MIVKITTRQAGGVTIVDVAGRYTLGGGTITFSDTVRQLVADGHKRLLLNLADLAYIDSSGLGEMVASLTVAAKQGGSLKLLGPSPRVSALLQITRVDKLFEIFDNEPDALRSFA